MTALHSNSITAPLFSNTALGPNPQRGGPVYTGGRLVTVETAGPVGVDVLARVFFRALPPRTRHINPGNRFNGKPACGGPANSFRPDSRPTRTRIPVQLHGLTQLVFSTDSHQSSHEIILPQCRRLRKRAPFQLHDDGDRPAGTEE